MSRSALSAAHLYAILDREFRAARSPVCADCRVPLPYFREPRDDVSANWDVGTPAFCPHGCHVAFAEVLAKLWTKYDLQMTPTQ